MCSTGMTEDTAHPAIQAQTKRSPSRVPLHVQGHTAIVEIPQPGGLQERDYSLVPK